MCLKRIVQVTQVRLEVNPVVRLPSLSQRINTPLFMESSSINNTIQFSLKVTAHGSCRAVQHMKGHHAHPHIQYTNKACVLSARAGKTLKRRHCFPPGVNNRRRRVTAFDKQSICTKKKNRRISELTIELINISAAQPWLFVHAIRGLMRQSCKDNVLAAADDLLKDKIIFQIPSISRALPGTSRY